MAAPRSGRAMSRGQRPASKPRPAKAPSKGGGIDMPKFIGEVGANLDRAIPSRQASRSVGGAMGGGLEGKYSRGNPVADLVSGVFKVKPRNRNGG